MNPASPAGRWRWWEQPAKKGSRAARSRTSALTLAHPQVRHDYFWAAIGRRRAAHMPESNHPVDVLSHYSGMLEPAPDDVDWLVIDLEQGTDDADREVALRHAQQWCNDLGRPWRLRRRIRRAIEGDERLKAIFLELDLAGRVRPLKRYYFRLEHVYLHRKRKAREAVGWLHGHWVRFRSRIYLWRNLDQIRGGERFHIVCQLIDQADPSSRDRWTVTRWEKLRRKWGSSVVMATRTAAKAFWRTFRPELPHESADPSRIPNGLIVGLTGLHTAWVDGELDWGGLSDEEVKTATRYALREMNGFPAWFQELCSRRPAQVGEVFAESIAGEWRQPPGPSPRQEGLQRLAWSGAPLLAPARAAVLSLLRQGDPPGTSLGLAATFVLNDDTPPLAELQALAASRIGNPATPTGPAALWFTIWLQIDPAGALDAWPAHLATRPDADQIMVQVCASLQDRDLGRGPRVRDPRYRNVASLRRLVPLVFAHVRLSEDIDRTRGGGYTPVSRDYAQEFRGSLLRLLADAADPAAADKLEELAELPLLAGQRDWLLHLRDEHWKQQADRERWRAGDVREFALKHETEPVTDRDLYRIVLKRLADIKRHVEISNLGWRTQVQMRPGDREGPLRIWLAGKFTELSRQRYMAPQEGVIDLNQRPDIRVEHARAGVVSLELKWAQCWSFSELVIALEDQLLRRYLREHNSRHGVLVLGMQTGGNLHWRRDDGRKFDFPELVRFFQARAVELEAQFPNVKRLSVVGIDFREPNLTRA
jgi:hypothetical protein